MDQNYEKTAILLEKAQRGNSSAREALYRRLIPRLESYARGRVPISVQSLADTQEIVQETVFRSLSRLEEFKPEHEGALLQYLKRILVNRIRDLARRSGREVPIGDAETIAARGEQTVVSRLVGEETLQRFSECLDSLTSDQRTAVSLYVELGYSLTELGDALNRSPDAARKLLARGLQSVSAKMRGVA